MTKRKWKRTKHPRPEIDFYEADDAGSMCREATPDGATWQVCRPRPGYGAPWVILSEEDVSLEEAEALYEEMFPFESPTGHWSMWLRKDLVEGP